MFILYIYIFIYIYIYIYSYVYTHTHVYRHPLHPILNQEIYGSAWASGDPTWSNNSRVLCSCNSFHELAGDVHSLHRSFSASSDCLNRTCGCGRQVVIVARWWKLVRRWKDGGRHWDSQWIQSNYFHTLFLSFQNLPTSEKVNWAGLVGPLEYFVRS